MGGSALRSGERTHRHHAIEHFSAHLERPADAYTDAYVAFRKKRATPRGFPLPHGIRENALKFCEAARITPPRSNGKSRHRTNAL
jgi:hypothetical protein